MEKKINETTTDSRIIVSGSLLQRATQDDTEAIDTIFDQFLSEDETIHHTGYYGYFGFGYVGFHSFCCLTDRRIASLCVGPFKKISYKDGFYENITSGQIEQPSKFWLYIFLLLGLPGVGMVFGFLFYTIFNFLFSTSLPGINLSDSNAILAGLTTLGILPFLGHAITMLFYAFNPCGLACWLRERIPVMVFINRDMMKRANRLYRMTTDLREERNRFIKKKSKKSENNGVEDSLNF